jgi:hypothetical protein
MTRGRERRGAGFTIAELLVAMLSLALVLAAILPSMARAQGSSGVQQSMSNLVTLGVSHVLYALDWDGRQVTWVKDDLGVYQGDVVLYNEAVGGCGSGFGPPECQPPMIPGTGCQGLLWAYWVTHGNRPMFQPIAFTGGPGSEYFGHFRIPNLRPFHEYVNGRYHDPVFYAPGDAGSLVAAGGCQDAPCEFVVYPGGDDPYHCNPGWSSYALSPAAMFHPDVFRSNAAGGWQPPWTLDLGYQSPGLFQATYPNLKTHMIEHNWFRNAPVSCNPAFADWCEPYWFNHGINVSPVTLFYDGSVRLLPNTEALAADQQVLDQTGGEDGLWHRGTGFGEDGYGISFGYDGTPVSHHILTTDGILGRDQPAGPAGRAPAARVPPSGGKRGARGHSRAVEVHAASGR